MSQQYPKTAEEWWASVDSNKDALRCLVENYHPVRLNKRRPTVPDMPITASRSEALRARFCDEFAQETDYDPATQFDALVAARDGKSLALLLSKTWFGIPESTDCWHLPAFGALSDLCSEAHVLGIEFEEDDDGPTPS